MESNKYKVAIVMPAYNAEKTLRSVIKLLPAQYKNNVLLVDDASQDQTVKLSQELGITTIVHKDNLGYGGNQKTCYKHILQSNYDIVVMLHPDGQYNPADVPKLVKLFEQNNCDMVIASRMRHWIEGYKGGMPIWKIVANRFLSTVANWRTDQHLHEWHSGYRAYRVNTLRQIGFDKFSNGFSFDIELALAILSRGGSINETFTATKYFPEASTIHFWPSIRYGFAFLKALVKYMPSQDV